MSKLYSEPTLQEQEQAAKHRELIFIVVVVVVALPGSLDVRLGVRRSEFGGNTQHSEVSPGSTITRYLHNAVYSTLRQ